MPTHRRTAKIDSHPKTVQMSQWESFAKMRPAGNVMSDQPIAGVGDLAQRQDPRPLSAAEYERGQCLKGGAVRRMPQHTLTRVLGVEHNAESIRSHLHRYIDSRHNNQVGTVVIDELGLCQGNARIDLAVVNGQLHGYEIKSDRDSLRRLSTQAALYGMVFDRVTLVCSERHSTKALEIVPDWWGILCIRNANRAPTFKSIRRSRKNPQRNARALAEFLWLEEAIALLAQHDSLRGMRGKPRERLWDRLCELLRPEELASVVYTHLKATAEKRGRPAPQP